MMVPLLDSLSVQQLLRGAGPVVLALQSPGRRDLMLARVQSPGSPEWAPASEWLTKQQRLDSAPVVPLYLGKAPGSELLVGKRIEAAALAGLGDAGEQLRYLRWRTSLLAERHAFKTRSALPLRRRQGKPPEPIAPPIAPELLEAEVAALAAGQAEQCRLAASGAFEVFLAGSRLIPNILAEIGRLRETAFRAAGEGTGRAYDLDRFDHSYLHLFVWNREAREIAGAYRLCFTGATAAGPDSLYTATLFHYSPDFLRRLGPAIELGRSFVRIEYQKSFTPLLLLWKGIGQIVSRHPDCKTLFGPVSISNQYQAISRELMIAFLEKRELLADLACLVRPRHAPPLRRHAPVNTEFCRSLDDLSDIVADLEPGQQGVPILLRHYLRLGGKLIGFNVDREFANALDGLIVVDLTRTEPRLLERYLGKEEAAALLAHHYRQ